LKLALDGADVNPGAAKGCGIVVGAPEWPYSAELARLGRLFRRGLGLAEITRARL